MRLDSPTSSDSTSSVTPRPSEKRCGECDEEKTGEQQYQLSREEMEREYASKAAANCFTAWKLEAEAFATEEERFEALNAALQLSSTVSAVVEGGWPRPVPGKAS